MRIPEFVVINTEYSPGLTDPVWDKKHFAAAVKIPPPQAQVPNPSLTDSKIARFVGFVRLAL